MKAAAGETEDSDEEAGEEIDGQSKSKKLKTEGNEQQDKPKALKIWFDKEVKISEAVETQNDWRENMRRTLREEHTKALDTFKDICKLY